MARPDIYYVITCWWTGERNNADNIFIRASRTYQVMLEAGKLGKTEDLSLSLRTWSKVRLLLWDVPRRRWPRLRIPVFFYVTSMVRCVGITWGSHAIRMHYGKETSHWRQCGVLGLLGNFGSCQPFGWNFDALQTINTFQSNIPAGCGLFQQDNLPCNNNIGVLFW